MSEAEVAPRARVVFADHTVIQTAVAVHIPVSLRLDIQCLSKVFEHAIFSAV